MASLSRKGRNRARPVMNVTPLVDVVLVLLIIFMIVIPAMEEGLNLEIPGIFNVDEQTDSSVEPFVLTFTGDGTLLFDEYRVERADLEEHLRAASRREPSRKLVLRGDERVRYAEIRDLYAVVQAVGFPGVSLRVNERQAAAENVAQANAPRDPNGTALARNTGGH